MTSRIPIPGEVWYATLPKEENPNDLMTNRPCIIVDQTDAEEFIVIKVTSHNPRNNDPYDVRLVYWGQCGLKKPSTARCSKLIILQREQIDNFKGRLSIADERLVSSKVRSYLESN